MEGGGGCRSCDHSNTARVVAQKTWVQTMPWLGLCSWPSFRASLSQGGDDASGGFMTMDRVPGLSALVAYTKISTNGGHPCSKLWGKLVPWAILVEWGHVDISVGLYVPTQWAPVLCLKSPISLDSRTMSVTAFSLFLLPTWIIPVSRDYLCTLMWALGTAVTPAF